MIDQIHTTRAPMSDAQKILLQTYPREAWDGHPNFRPKTINWLNAHQSFRAIGEICQEACEHTLSKDWSEEKLARYLSHYGNMLVGNLHGHHSWEDHEFFPEILNADARAEAGLDLLESDHQELDERLDKITRQSNRVIKLAELDISQVHDEIGKLLPEFLGLNALLARHLEDEEDLIVPIIIHNKLRG